MVVFAHLTADIYIHVLQGQDVFAWEKGLACVFPLFLYLGSEVQLHMFGRMVPINILYTLYCTSCRSTRWTGNLMSFLSSRISYFVHFLSFFCTCM